LGVEFAVSHFAQNQCTNQDLAPQVCLALALSFDGALARVDALLA
jgi:hypothetical protein